MAKEWGFEDDEENDASGLNQPKKMARANPIIGTVKKYADNLGNMLEQTGGGDGAPLPLLPESANKENTQGSKKPLISLDPDPVVTRTVPAPHMTEQEKRDDNLLKDRMLFPDRSFRNMGNGIIVPGAGTGDERMAISGAKTGDEGIVIVPKPDIGGDKMPVVPNRLNGKTGNPNGPNGQKNEEGQPDGAAIGAESANLPDLSLFFGNKGISPEKPDGQANRFTPVTTGTASKANMTRTANTAINLEHADPMYWLVEKESENYIASNEKILNRLFVQNSDMAKGLADVKNARFDPEGLSWYGKEQRELMQALMSAHIGVAHSTFDPVMAQKQAYPFLNRLYNASVASAGGDLSGISQGSFSLDTLNEQVKTHLQNGSQPDLRFSQTVANAMNSLDNTAYGRVTKNFMASVHRGMVNLTENSLNTALTIMSSAPPPETAMFHYQQMYIAHGNDTAGMARELENMTGFTGKLQESISGEAERVKGMYAGMRSDDYNRLEWLTLNPGQAAWMRPDKMTGDLFEKLVPAMLGMKGVSKVGEGMNLAKKGDMFIKGSVAVNTGYRNAYMATKRDMLANYDKIDRDPDYIRYRQESQVSEARAKEIYVEAKSRQNGVQAGLLTLVTFTGTTLFRQATDTGAENPVIQLFRQIVGAQTSSMAKEAFGGARGVDYESFNQKKKPKQ